MVRLQRPDPPRRLNMTLMPDQFAEPVWERVLDNSLAALGLGE